MHNCAAQCNYISMDRFDIAFASKDISRKVSAPTIGDMIALKRLMRFQNQIMISLNILLNYLKDLIGLRTKLP